jgi:hypothetical protein
MGLVFKAIFISDASKSLTADQAFWFFSSPKGMVRPRYLRALFPFVPWRLPPAARVGFCGQALALFAEADVALLLFRFDPGPLRNANLSGPIGILSMRFFHPATVSISAGYRTVYPLGIRRLILKRVATRLTG